MVSLSNLLPNGNKQQNNVAVNYSENLNMPESPLKNPDYGKDIKIHGPDDTYNIDVHYSTDLTHPELAPQSPVPNPVLERTKTLSPVQQISIIGRGTDPNVSIRNSHISHYVREKDQPIETQTLTKTQTTTQTTNLTPQEVLGPIMNRYLNYDPNYFAQKVLQITDGLTLLELFQILGQDPRFWTPAYSFSSFPGGSAIYVVNVELSGNKIIFSNQSQINTSWSGGF